MPNILLTLFHLSEKEAICSMSADPGPYLDYELRYYFNSESGECEPFIYGGSVGNANNFKSKEDCEALCGGKTFITEHLKITKKIFVK